MLNSFLSVKRQIYRVFRLVKGAVNPRKSFRFQAIAPKFINHLTQLEACCGPVSSKKVLEIGCDPRGEFLNYLTSQRSMDKAIGINISLKENFLNEKYTLLKEDARSLPFENDSFDLITSISAFEHIFDLDIALAEMYRVLKPGGRLFTEFAPIWSGVWGHHLWFYHDGKVRNWVNTPLPPYAHLIMEETDLRAWVRDKYHEESLCNKILDYVYRSDEQNHLFYNDYERIVGESDFNIIFLVGLCDLPLRKGYEVQDLEPVMNRLRQKFPEKSGFGYLGISMLLIKS